MANVVDVAKYILGCQGEMSTMKLEKLCYYAQAWSLAWDGIPLFEEDFEAWANGPVCPALFRWHRKKFMIGAQDLPQMSGELSERERETIREVLDYYGDKEAHWLSELTHKELPWKSARRRADARSGEPCSEVITKSSMQEYYAGLE
ncbi:MAG: SocA family protein [Oscillospiraceae bacterium]|nr:SocA family protein [Oscillospiraceae bacterium]